MNQKSLPEIQAVLFKTLIYCVFLVFVVVNLYPIIWVLMSSLKTNSEFFENLFGPPRGFQYLNFKNAWIESKISVYFVNSLYVSSASIAIITILALMISYVLARQNFWLRGAVYTYFLLGMLVPVHSTLVPIFVMFSSLNFLNKWFTLLLPYTGFGLPFAIFILESFIRSIPKEIDEAATIDGSGSTRILFQIISPLCGPAIATVCIMTFFNIWNDFVFPLILITDDGLKTIQLGLQNFIGPRSANYAQLMAALTIATIPVLAVYFAFQKKVISGMTAGAVKG